jgi:hypothetical protein
MVGRLVDDDLEECGCKCCGLKQALAWHLSADTQKNHKKRFTNKNLECYHYIKLTNIMERGIL